MRLQQQWWSVLLAAVLMGLVGVTALAAAGEQFIPVLAVREGAGPFEYVRSSAPGGRYGDLWPWRAGEGIKPPDDELAATVAPDDRVVCAGPAGTLILCDTSGFHRGGFAREAPRISAVWTFVSPDSEPGQEHRFEVDFGGREGDLSEQALFALS
jgi:hypothetical protein